MTERMNRKLNFRHKVAPDVFVPKEEFPALNGPIVDLCDIAEHYAAENRAKAKRLRSTCYKGSQSPRADDLESAALIIEQLTKVMRPLADFKALCEADDGGGS